MSVVNKMLQDLDARQSQGPLITADYQPPQENRRLLWLLLIIGAVLLLAAWLWFKQAQNETTEPEDVPQTAFGEAQTPLAKEPEIGDKAMQRATSTIPVSTDPQAGRDSEAMTTTLQPELLSGEALPPSILSHFVGVSDKIAIRSSAALAASSPSAATVIGDDANAEQKVLAPQPEIEPKNPRQQSEFSIKKSEPTAKSDGARQKVRNALRDGDKVLAIARLQQLVASEPENISFRKKLASLLFAQGSDAQAGEILVHGVATHPGRSDLRLMLARLYVQQKNNEEAIALLEGFEPSVDTQKEYWAFRAVLAQKLGKYTLAKNDYLQLTRSNPSKASWWLGLAIALDRLGHKTEALEAYRQANDKEQLPSAVATFMLQRIALIGATI